MYSFIEVPGGHVAHLSASTPLKYNKAEGYYEIDNEGEES
jgi:hypothetical protein